MAVKSLIKTGSAPKATPAMNGNARAVQKKIAPGLFTPSLVQRKEQTGSWVHTQTQKPVNARSFIQPKLKIHASNDHFEQEADHVADKVISNQKIPSSTSISKINGGTQRKSLSSNSNRVSRAARILQAKHNSAKINLPVQSKNNSTSFCGNSLQCADSGPPVAQQAEKTNKLQSVLSQQSTRGSPLPTTTRTRMESSMGADFSAVRIHTGNESHEAGKSIGARAFTNGPNIHFANGQYNPDTKAGQHLLAHELTHTLQQGATPARSNVQKSSDNFTIQRNSSEINSERGPPVQAQAETGTVQCSLIDTALDRIGELLDDLPSITEGLEGAKRWLTLKVRKFASFIPGYTALGVVLQQDPITGEHIDRSGRNFINAALDIIPGGSLLKQKLEELGAIDRAGAWIDTQLESLSSILAGVHDEFMTAWNALGITSILDGPLNIIRNFGNIFLRAINQLVSFAERAASELLSIVKEFLLTQVVNFIKNHTNAYELLKVIIGHDPITEERVERNGTNILNALLELGGEQGREQRRQMQDTGSFQKAADWIDRGIAVFGNLYQTIRDNFGLIWDAVSIQSLMDPIGTFNRIYTTFAEPVGRVLQFVADTLVVILGFIKEVLLQRLSAWARTVRGYPLVTVLIGKDPFTNENVQRSVPNIIRGFMSLMEGGEDQYRQMEESGAIGRATAQINAAVTRLNMTPAYVVQLFTDLWNSFSFNDLSHPIEAFQRIIARFGEPIARLIAFVFEIVRIVIHVILQVMNFPFDLINNIINRAMEAIENIKRDPIGFLKNLMRAIKQGFMQFFDNIVTHLINGVVGWLMSELKDANIPELKDFTLKGVIAWILQVLNITMESIWEKLAKHPRIGPERVAKIRSMINTLEGIWTFIKDVQERGMAAIWDKIKEQLTNLWNTVLDAVKNWIMEKIVAQVTVKLLSLLDPTGIMAVINSAIAIYKAVQSFIKYLRQMLEVINSFVNGVADIAAGNVSTAANYLERTMGRAMPIVIGFLANQVGLGGIGKRIGEMIVKAREMVDKALTWLVNKAVDTGFAIFDKLVSMGKSAAGAVMGWLGLSKTFKAKDGEEHTLSSKKIGSRQELMVASGTPKPVRQFLATLDVSGNDDLKKARQRVQSKLEKMDTLLANIPAGNATDSAKEVYRLQVDDQADQINQDMADLMAGASSNAPTAKTTNPAYDGVVGGSPGWGKGMRVQIVSTPPPGGTTTGDPSGHASWQALKKRKKLSGGTGTLYVQGHLLNNHLGGPGSNFNNLTPLTQDANGQFEKDAESYIKNRLSIKTGTSKDASRLDTGMLFLYNVIPIYGRTVNSSLVNKINAIPTGATTASGNPPSQLTAQDKATLIAIVENERYVPNSVRYNIIVKNPNDDTEMNEYTKRDQSLDNSIDQSTYHIAGGSMQFKLKRYGSVNAYEKEADHIADRVTGQTHSAAPITISRINGGIQTKIKDDKKPVAPKKNEHKVETALTNQQTRGSPLPAAVKTTMENKMGADFSKVRIHTGNDSQKANDAIGARAFTQGANIHFGAGEFDHSSKKGQHLLAHELTHTVQQGAASQKQIANPPDKKIEKEDVKTKSPLPIEKVITPAVVKLPTGKGATGVAGTVAATPKHRAAAQKQIVNVYDKKAAPLLPNQQKRGSPLPHANRSSIDDKMGNTVSEIVSSATVATAIADSPTSSKKDPAFQQGKKSINTESHKQKTHHTPAASKRAEAEAAAALNPNEQISQDAKEKNTETIKTVAEQQSSQRFSADSFKKSLKVLINEKKPTTEDAAKAMAENPPVGNITQSFSTGVAKEQSGIVGPLEKNAVPNPTGGELQKEIIDLPSPKNPPVPKLLASKLVIPKAKTDPEISEKNQSDRIDSAMAKNKLSDDQLVNSKEPSFIQTYKTKEQAKQKAAEAPGIYRNREQAILESAEVKAGTSVTTELNGLARRNIKSGGEVHKSQSGTESTTETRQRGIKNFIDGAYAGVVTEVKSILLAMSEKVKTDFTNSLKVKTDLFNENLKSRISSYYGNFRIDDELFGPSPVVVNEDGSTRSLTSDEAFAAFRGKEIETINPDVYEIFVSEKDIFTNAMDKEFDGIASSVEKGLRDAHDAINKGQDKITGFKTTLKGDELTYANQLEEEVKIKFGTLESSIDEAKDDLLHTLADQYKDNLEAMKKSFKDIDDELKKSWIDSAIEFIETVGKTIYQLVNLIISVLARLISIVWDIVKHPIRFFETLVKGLMEGIGDFISNIGTHMTECFWTWVTGSVPSNGVKLTMGSGVEGMFKLVVNVLNLGIQDLKKVAEKVLGKEFMEMTDKVMDMINKGIDIGTKVLEPFIILITKGPLALWQYVKEHVQEFIQSSFDKIKESVFFAFIEKGIKWIASFFVPGGGFVKVVQAVVAAFKFIAANLENIRHFFDSILDSMEGAVAGDTTVVKNKIVTGLKAGVVMALDFLAKILGLDKIVSAIHQIIDKIKNAILGAVEFILVKIKPFILGVVNKVKALYNKGKEKVMAVAGAAKDKVLGWLGLKKQFKDESGESHSLYYNNAGPDAEIILASTPRPIRTFLQEYIAKNQNDPSLAKKVDQARNALDFIRQEIVPIQRSYSSAKEEPEKKILEGQILSKFEELSNMVRLLLGDGNLNSAFDKYHLEGLSGTYSTMPKPKGDNFTADHQPQAAILEEAAAMPIFNEPGINNMLKRASGRANNGYAINLHYIRHKEGRTYGSKGGQTKNEFLANVTAKTTALTTSKEKREAVVGSLKNELMKDVITMRTLVRRDDPVFWDDLIKIKQQNNLSDKEFEQLKSRIRNQILAGEDQMLSQDLDSLKT